MNVYLSGLFGGGLLPLIVRPFSGQRRGAGVDGGPASVPSQRREVTGSSARITRALTKLLTLPRANVLLKLLQLSFVESHKPYEAVAALEVAADGGRPSPAAPKEGARIASLVSSQPLNR